MKNLDIIYCAARELSPEARPAYLRKACGSDKALRLRIEQMLSLASDAEAFITDRPARRTPPESEGRSTTPS